MPPAEPPLRPVKLISDVVAHGFALAVAIVALAMAAELKQELKVIPLERQPQNQTVTEFRQERKDLKTERKARRDRRKERREGKPGSKIPT